jgi:hypothetical protein
MCENQSSTRGISIYGVHVLFGRYSLKTGEDYSPKFKSLKLTTNLTSYMMYCI